MLIKKDRNKELEKILEQKKIDEQAKNLLQGILYKLEVSYKDYRKVKAKKQTEEKYIKELLTNIDKKCDKINVVKLSQKLENEKIQKELEQNKYYVEDDIVSYPIEEKILYAIEKKSRFPKILNNKYQEATIAISHLINTGKNIDRVEALKDFNGWSWTTINKEMENIEANLVYQIIQIMLGEEFVEKWTQDKDGIIDCLELFEDELKHKYREDIAKNQKKLLIKIAIANTIKYNPQYAQDIIEKIQKITKEIEKYENTEQKIIEITNHKKQLLQELNEIEKVIGQNTRLTEEFEKTNEEATIVQKVFNIKVFKKQLENKKQNIIEQIENDNYLLNPSNYLAEKNKLLEQKQKLENMNLEQEEMLLQFIENFLNCFKILIKKTTDEEEIVKLIYQFRYFMQLPYDLENNIKDVKKLEKNITSVERKLVQKAIEKKVIKDVPFEIMQHVFRTRIILLEELYYKITVKSEKYYVQIFDKNISEEKFEITPVEKMKINKKIKIFI